MLTTVFSVINLNLLNFFLSSLGKVLFLLHELVIEFSCARDEKISDLRENTQLKFRAKGSARRRRRGSSVKLQLIGRRMCDPWPGREVVVFGNFDSTVAIVEMAGVSLCE